MNSRRRRLLETTTASLAALALPGARAREKFPDRPIKLVIPFPPGGPNDQFGRILGRQLGDILGQPVVIDNKPGAAGIIGSESVARAKPDGYTLLFGTAATHAINLSLYRKLPYHPLRDFEPIGFVGVVPTVLLAHPSLPGSLPEVIALLKANPDKYRYGSAGNGTVNHLAGEMLNAAIGTSMTHVPYKGGGQILQDLLGGQIHFAFETFGSAMPYLQSGRVKALALAAARRSTAAPEVPTFAQAGLADFEASTWNVVMAPADTPKAAVQRLSLAVNEAMRDGGVRERLVRLGIVAVDDSTPASTANTIQREIDRWAKAVELSGARAAGTVQAILPRLRGAKASQTWDALCRIWMASSGLMQATQV